MKPEIIEVAAEAAWNLKANRLWKDIPEEWKPFYRETMAAGLEAASKSEAPERRKNWDSARDGWEAYEDDMK